MNEVLDFSTAYPDILLLIGNEFDRLKKVAGAISDLLRDCGFRVRNIPMKDATPEMLLDYYQLIICSGASQSEADDNVFLKELLEEEAPDLSHLAFGTLTFIEKGERGSSDTTPELEEVLDKLGAVEVVDPYVIEGDANQEKVSNAQYWGLDCVAAFSEAFAPADLVVY